MAKKKKNGKKTVKPTTDTTPSSVNIVRPSVEELAMLPLRAIVAYAVRCARRVQPLSIEMGMDSLKAVEVALDQASRFASGENFVQSDELMPVSASNTTSGEFYAYNAAIFAAKTVTSASPASAANTAEAAADAADYACKYGYNYHDADADADAWHDIQMLKALTAGVPAEQVSHEFWIDPSESGQLGNYWSVTAPDWYETKKELLGKLRENVIQSVQIENLIAEKSNLAKELKTRELQSNEAL